MEQLKTSLKLFGSSGNLLGLGIFLGSIALLSGCYYDNEEYLYGDQNACNPVNVSYGAEVAPILETNCLACHSGAGASGGIALDTYDQVMVYVDSGQLMCSISHGDGCSPMPQNAAQLLPCSIQTIDQWIGEGSPDN